MLCKSSVNPSGQIRNSSSLTDLHGFPSRHRDHPADSFHHLPLGHHEQVLDGSGLQQVTEETTKIVVAVLLFFTCTDRKTRTDFWRDIFCHLMIQIWASFVVCPGTRAAPVPVTETVCGNIGMIGAVSASRSTAELRRRLSVCPTLQQVRDCCRYTDHPDWVWIHLLTVRRRVSQTDRQTERYVDNQTDLVYCPYTLDAPRHLQRNLLTADHVIG